MDVKSFVTETIVQICEGVTDAVSRLEGSDAIVSPSGIVASENSMYVHEDYRRIVQNVEFDVAVTVTEAQGSEGGLGLMVGMIGLGSKGKSDSENSSTSRIRFSVPVSLPTSNVNKS